MRVLTIGSLYPPHPAGDVAALRPAIARLAREGCARACAKAGWPRRGG